MPFPDSPNKCFHFATNALAYRTEEIPFEKTAGEYRLVVLGDSHTNGMGVDDADRFSNLIERALAAAPRHAAVHVMNFGRPGTTIPDYLADLEVASAWRPDAALCIINSGNDLAGMIPYLDGGYPHGPVSSSATDRLLGIPRRMYLYHLLAFSRQAFDLVLHGGGTGRPLNMREPFTQAIGQADYYRRHAEQRDRSLARFREYLFRLRGRCERSKTRGYLAILPTKLQVEADLCAETGRPITQKIGLDWDDAVARDLETHRSIVEVAREVDPDVSDLLVDLHRSSIQGEKYWHNDWHLSVEGHQIVASALQARLKRDPPASTGVIRAQ